jgi:hypothetical protein
MVIGLLLIRVIVMFASVGYQAARQLYRKRPGLRIGPPLRPLHPEGRYSKRRGQGR